MTEGDALYRAILAAPDDDAPRLVWADWLDENGDPERAEFVRLQCEWANLVRGDPRYIELLESSNLLAMRHRDRWVGDVGRFKLDCWFWRGLPDYFVLPTGEAAKRIAEVRQHVPAQCVILNLSKSSAPLGPWPGVDRIRHLEVLEDGPDPFYPQSSVRGWIWLIQFPQLSGLRSLVVDLDYTSAGAISAIAATEWPKLRQLQLHMRGAHLAAPSAAWTDLPDASWFPRLRSLDLYGCSLGERVTRKLLLSRGPLALTHLELGGNELSPAFIRRLLRSPMLRSLRLLEIGGVRAEDAIAGMPSAKLRGRSNAT